MWFSFISTAIQNVTVEGGKMLTFLIMKANEMHCFSDLFDKALYMFRTGPLSIVRSNLMFF